MVTPINPYESSNPEAAQSRLQANLRFYWNTVLSGMAFCMHCIPFASFDFIDDDGQTGRSLFPLAPLALLLATFCALATVVQIVILIVAFVDRWPTRHARSLAVAGSIFAIAMIFVTGRFGWFIHV